MHANAEIVEQALLQPLQVFKVLQVFQAVEQALFFLAGQQEYALGGLRVVGQLFATTNAGARGKAGATVESWSWAKHSQFCGCL